MKQDGTLPQRVKVVKLMWWIPHFRAPIFRRLSQNPHLDFVVCAGDSTRGLAGEKIAASAAETGSTKGIHWRPLASHCLGGPLLKNYEWQPEAVKIAWKEEMDVLICHGNQSLSNWLVRAICRMRRIPLIEWTQGIRGPERGLKWAVRKFYLKWANAQLLYGTFARDFFASHGFKNEELFVVHNSLDYERQVSIRERLTPEDSRQTREQFGVIDPEERLIFHSGRLVPSKNLDLLIRATKALQTGRRRVVLVLIGDGGEGERLRRQARSDDIQDRVVFHGACYDEEELGRIITASDLCVSPGATGLLVMHALVYGTPILTCENTAWLHGPEVEAVVEGQTGCYFRDGDLDDLVAKIEAMLYPTARKEGMRAACKRMIDEYYTPEYQERVIIRALNHVLPEEKRIPLPE